eukprot:m.142754 g.142754  ORF g.142754 m.142754 type:complete len:342 (-) comp10040_c0_seq2:3028-4053(-)
MSSDIPQHKMYLKNHLCVSKDVLLSEDLTVTKFRSISNMLAHGLVRYVSDDRSLVPYNPDALQAILELFGCPSYWDAFQALFVTPSGQCGVHKKTLRFTTTAQILLYLGKFSQVCSSWLPDDLEAFLRSHGASNRVCTVLHSLGLVHNRHPVLPTPQDADKAALNLMAKFPNAIVTTMIDDFYFALFNRVYSRDEASYKPCAVVGVAITVHPNTHLTHKIMEQEMDAFQPVLKKQVDKFSKMLVQSAASDIGSEPYRSCRKETRRVPFSPRNIYMDKATAAIHSARSLSHTVLLRFDVDQVMRTTSQLKSVMEPLLTNRVLQKIVERQGSLLIPCDFGVAC